MGAKTKILYIINSLNIGGSEKVAIDSVNSLDPEKYTISIISLSLYDPEKSIFKVIALKPGIEVFYFNFEHDEDFSLTGYLRFLLRKKESFKHFQSINALISKISPNIIHFHTSPRELILRDFFDIQVPCLFTDHSLRIRKNELSLLRTAILSFVFRRLYKNFQVIAVSEEIRKTLYERKIVSSRTPIETIRNGVNVDFFKNDSSIKVEGLAVAYISRIEPTKGHEDLIKAWSLLTDITDKKLSIAGPDGMHGKIQKLSQDLHCEDTVQFMGSISHPRSLLQKVNLAVFPSYKEGLPLSLLEKMAMQLPVIVADIPELTSIITDNKNGLVFKLGNSADLADKIRYVYKNPEVAKALGAEARKTVISDYNLADNLIKLDSLYTKLVN